MSLHTTSDSIAFVRFDSTFCVESEAPWSAREQAASFSGRVPYTEGIPPTPRKLLPGYDSGVMTLLIVVLLFITINFRHYSTFLKTFTQHLFSVRTRANAFDDRNTVSETRILLSLVILVCLCEGILMFSYLTTHGVNIAPFVGISTISSIAIGYYVWQLFAYNIIGYTFASPHQRSIWIKGFNASQSLLGITLVIPAIISLFNPGLTPFLLSISVMLYVMARIIFIIKGFRIFYNNSFALLYFILYLCALEMIPLIIVYKTTIQLVSNL